MAKYNIGGYIFEDENKAKKAAKELKSVEYLLGQLKDADEKGVLTVYKKLLNQRLFSTEIGMSFLSQLRQNLLASGAFSEDEVPAVYSLEVESDARAASSESKAAEVKEEKKPTPKVQEQKADKVDVAKGYSDSAELKRLKRINRVLLILCIAFGLCIIGMFYVNSTINSPTILNYEEQILDKYSSWEQELSEREAAIKEKELSQQ